MRGEPDGHVTKDRGAHRLDADVVHYGWDGAIPPRLTVASGDVVTISARGGGDDYFSRTSTSEDVRRRPRPEGHALTGPISVAGARPGDVLEIEIIEIETWDWGYTFINRGFGLLQEDFVEPYLQIWDLSQGDRAVLRPGIAVPIEPFLGILGLAPGEAGRHPTWPPRRVGGNLDLKHIGVGARLWLPIETEGALLSAGDAHAAQGDGEVCITAIETGATATLRLTVRDGWNITAPEFQTAGPLTPRTNTGPWYGTTGVGPDLMAATKDAVRAMIRYLRREHGLTPEEAYVLSSVAVDLKINEVVDAPNWVVSACLPLSIFSR